MKAHQLSNRQLAGQRLMAGFDGIDLNPDLKALIEDLKVGGLILFQGIWWIRNRFEPFADPLRNTRPPATSRRF